MKDKGNDMKTEGLGMLGLQVKGDEGTEEADKMLMGQQMNINERERIVAEKEAAIKEREDEEKNK